MAINEEAIGVKSLSSECLLKAQERWERSGRCDGGDDAHVGGVVVKRERF